MKPASMLQSVALLIWMLYALFFKFILYWDALVVWELPSYGDDRSDPRIYEKLAKGLYVKKVVKILDKLVSAEKEHRAGMCVDVLWIAYYFRAGGENTQE
jgi:hypothetical protein